MFGSNILGTGWHHWWVHCSRHCVEPWPNRSKTYKHRDDQRHRQRMSSGGRASGQNGWKVEYLRFYNLCYLDGCHTTCQAFRKGSNASESPQKGAFLWLRFSDPIGFSDCFLKLACRATLPLVPFWIQRHQRPQRDHFCTSGGKITLQPETCRECVFLDPTPIACGGEQRAWATATALASGSFLSHHLKVYQPICSHVYRFV